VEQCNDVSQTAASKLVMTGFDLMRGSVVRANAPSWACVDWRLDEHAPLNVDIAKRQTQHKNIQLLTLRRKGKQHSNDIVDALYTYQRELLSLTIATPPLHLQDPYL
jgi:hypothetical protein